MENRIRAIVRGLTKRQAVEALSKLFVGEQAQSYAEMAASNLTTGTIITGTSMRNIYEIAFGRRCPYVGDTADYYAQQELHSHGFTNLRIVTETQFAEELRRTLGSSELPSGK